MAELSKYELSVWEDVTTGIDPEKNPLGYFDEKKLAVIGADGVQNKIFAYDISLNENINGEKTLTFSLPSKYRDDGGVLLDNPLLQYLVSERKVKLRDGELPPIEKYKTADNSYTDQAAKWAKDYNYDDVWHDFIIKDISEDSEKYVNTYTCKELHVNELGKNGYSVLMDDELGNNYGTLQELGDYAMEGSGWRVEVKGTLYERVNEPLFYATTSKAIAVEQLGNAQGDDQLSAIPAEKIFYTFYSQLTQYEQTIKVNDIDKTILVWKAKPATELPNGNIQVIYSEKTLTYDDQYVLVDDEDINYLVQAKNLADLQWTPCGSEIGNSIHNQAIQGGRFVDSPHSFFEPIADKQVIEYQGANSQTYYVYQKTEFIKPILVNNLLANSSEFVNSSSWAPAHDKWGRIGLATYPILNGTQLQNYINGSEIPENIPTNYLTPSSNATIYNRGLRSAGVRWIKGQQYYFEITGAVATAANADGELQWRASTSTEIPQGSWGYSIGYLDNEVYHKLELASEEKIPTADDEPTGRYKYVITIGDIGNYNPEENHEPVLALTYYSGDKPVAAANLPYDQNGKINIKEGESQTHTVIKNVVLSPYYIQTTVDNGVEVTTVIKPGDAPDLEPIITYVAYQIEYGASGKEIKEIATWTDKEAVPDSIGSPKMNGYGAVRHINVKESNYFNIANDLAELFGWWVSFKIPHRNDGKLFQGELPAGVTELEVTPEDNFPPHGIFKRVLYTRYHGNDYLNSAGFKYGINEKGIKRTNDSKGLVTKLIVKDSYQELAENGIVSIRGAKSNPTGDTNIYNFTYYINHGLLKQFDVLNDLYGMSGTGTFNYYNEVSKLMQLYAPIEQELVAAEGALQAAKDGLANAELMITEANQEIQSKKEQYDFYLGIYKDYLKADGEEIGHPEQHPTCAGIAAAICSLIAQKQQFEQDLVDYGTQVKKYNALIYGVKENSDDIPADYKGMYFPEGTAVPGYDDWHTKTFTDDDGNKTYDDPSDREKLKNGPLSVAAEAFRLEKKRIDSEFYAKYSRYIQEGTWSDDKYVDSELYYLDGKKVSDQNAYPKTTYTISVVDVSAADKYKAYTFKVGDRTYVEDTEFFGYQYVNNILTPVKKEVIVSERKRFLDNPSKSTITVKTYKNQFEDLFSKITATTQSLSNASGGYQRAANVVQNDGSIKIESLEQAMANNAWTIASSSTNQNVEWNNGDGITVTDLKNSLLKVRITSRGIATSTDGGQTWTTGISAQGINTSLLQAGAISTEDIRISSPAHQNGAAFTWDKKGIAAYSPDSANKFVRFDEYGIYGTTKGYDLDEELSQAQSANDSTPATYQMRRAARATKTAAEVIREKSNFSLTWDGLELSYQDNKTSVSATRGLEVISSTTSANYYRITEWNNGTPNFEEVKNATEVPVLSVGYYINEDSTVEAGFVARALDGTITTRLTKEGLWATNANLTGTITAKEGWIKGALQVGSEDSTTYIGDLKENWTDENKISHPIIFKSSSSDKQNVLITDDGYLIATNAVISGTINADDGIFNNVEINDATIKGAEISEGTIDSAQITKGTIQEAQITYGTITEAIIAKTYFDAKKDSYIGLPSPNSDIYINIKDAFTVTKNGKITLSDTQSSLTLSPNGTEGEYYFKATVKNKDVLTINDEGLRISGEMRSHIYDETGGMGWKLQNDGTAYFTNAYISGVLSAVTFEYRKITAVGGILQVTPTIVIEGDDLRPTNSIVNANNQLYYYDLTYELLEPDSKGQSRFTDIEHFNLWKPVDLILITLDDGTEHQTTLKYDVKKPKELTFACPFPKIPKGSRIISRSTKTNSIRINSENIIGPRIEMLGPRPAKKAYAPRVIVGALMESDDVYEYFKGSINGEYGLYADSVFLTGRLYLPNAGIDNDESGEDPIRFWAGSRAFNKKNAPFRVTHAGRVYATDGYFKGTIEATDGKFSGTLQAAGAKLIPDKAATAYNESHFPFYLEEGGSLRLLAGVDTYGIHSWSGFTLFSQDAKVPEQEQLHYPYTDVQDRQYWPSVSFIDSGEASRLSASRIHVWGLQDNDKQAGVLINHNSIDFGVSSAANMNYKDQENSLFLGEKKLSIRYDDKSKQAQIQTSSLAIINSATGDELMETDSSGLKCHNNLIFDSGLQIQPVEEGLIFVQY